LFLAPSRQNMQRPIQFRLSSDQWINEARRARALRLTAKLSSGSLLASPAGSFVGL